MMEKENEINRGKTKAVFATADPKMVVLQNLDALTKRDDASLTKQMEGKAVHATTTTCNVFRLLKEAGIPVAFEKQLSETEFLAQRCQMIPLEVIVRRYAVGSYLQRFPNLKTADGLRPHRFHNLMFELFLKTTGGIIRTMHGKEVASVPVEDPLIIDNGGSWNLFHPKIPSWQPEADLKHQIVDFKSFLSLGGPGGVIHGQGGIEELARKTFLLLEGAWAQLGCRLIDFKIEFGWNSTNQLVIADVIDNDSWRLRTSNWEEVSKECFRQNAGLTEISEKYELVARMSDSFRLPRQAIVTWRGSDKDPTLEFDGESIKSVELWDIVCSGHKSPTKSLRTLENILAEFPEGGVIVAMVGMSNGLGPMLAARTNWPVISVPVTANTTPSDVWSSLRCPSNVPMLTVLSAKNAKLAALNILAQKNPLIYMLQQKEIEKLDI